MLHFHLINVAYCLNRCVLIILVDVLLINKQIAATQMKIGIVFILN